MRTAFWTACYFRRSFYCRATLAPIIAPAQSSKSVRVVESVSESWGPAMFSKSGPYSTK